MASVFAVFKGKTEAHRPPQVCQLNYFYELSTLNMLVCFALLSKILLLPLRTLEALVKQLRRLRQQTPHRWYFWLRGRIPVLHERHTFWYISSSNCAKYQWQQPNVSSKMKVFCSLYLSQSVWANLVQLEDVSFPLGGVTHTMANAISHCKLSRSASHLGFRIPC